MAEASRIGVLASIASRTDSIMNLFTGLGDALYDRNRYNSFVSGRKLSDAECAALFQDDDTGRLICDLPGFDALRQGVKVTSTDDVSGVDDAISSLGALEVYQQAMALDRAFGGAAILIGVDDGTSDDALPVRVDAVKSILYLKPVDRRRLRALAYNGDVRSPQYGEVDKWEILPTSATKVERDQRKSITGSVTVHASRLVVFPGRFVTDDRRAENDGWGDSVFKACLEALESNAVSWSTLAHLISKCGQGVLKIKDLALLATTSDQDAVRARFEMIRLGRGAVKDLVIDDGESYEPSVPNFGNLPEVLDRIMYRLSSATEIPVTRLFGRSPAGMNATGDSDERNWNNVVKALQTHKLEPRLRKFLDLLFAAKEGPTKGKVPEAYKITFPPLRQMTETETAALRKSVADADAIYLTQQVVTPEEIAVSRFAEDGWSMDTAIDIELRKSMIEATTIQSIEAEKEAAQKAAADAAAALADKPSDSPQDSNNGGSDVQQ